VLATIDSKHVPGVAAVIEHRQTWWCFRRTGSTHIHSSHIVNRHLQDIGLVSLAWYYADPHSRAHTVGYRVIVAAVEDKSATTVDCCRCSVNICIDGNIEINCTCFLLSSVTALNCIHQTLFIASLVLTTGDRGETTDNNF